MRGCVGNHSEMTNAGAGWPTSPTPPPCLLAVDCYGRHPHHHGGSGQHQKRLERGFAVLCHDVPPIVARKTLFLVTRSQGAANCGLGVQLRREAALDWGAWPPSSGEQSARPNQNAKPDCGNPVIQSSKCRIGALWMVIEGTRYHENSRLHRDRRAYPRARVGRRRSVSTRQVIVVSRRCCGPSYHNVVTALVRGGA
jgi:hypothetical protein